MLPYYLLKTEPNAASVHVTGGYERAINGGPFDDIHMLGFARNLKTIEFEK